MQPVESAAERTLILITVSLCTMLYSLTVTIANVTLPQLQGALSATPDQVSWIITLNIVATAVVTPASGWLVGRFGQRRLLLWSITGFTLATLACAFAESLGPLLLYRIGQGAFGAPLVPLSQAIVVATYPPEQRARAQSIFGMAVVIGPAVGPVFGGYLAELYNWRWVFLLVVPLCVVALVCVWFFIRDGGRNARVKLDWTGFLALSIAVTCMQLVMDRGDRLDWFESTEILILSAVTLWAFYTFVVHTITSKNPFISPTLFRDQNFTVGVILVFAYGMLNFTPIVLFPPMLQLLKGWPDSLIGYMLAMRGAGLVLGFYVAGKMGQLDPRYGLLLGIAFVGYSGIEMMRFDLNVPDHMVAWVGVLQGIGCGVMWVPLSVITFATLPPKLLADGAAIFHLLRNFGSSIFISISVMAVIRTSKINYSQIAENVSLYSENWRPGTVVEDWNIETVRGLAAVSNEVNRQAQMIGYTNAFLMYTVACFASLPLLFLVRMKRT
jgi:MFS transporter, DHA2 family, multidrug resistance protein